MDVLHSTQEIAPFVRILGCYPVDMASGFSSPAVQSPASEEAGQSIGASQNGSLPSPGGLGDSEKLLISAAANGIPIHQVRSVNLNLSCFSA